MHTASLARELGRENTEKSADKQVQLAELRTKILREQEKIFADVKRFLPVTGAENASDDQSDKLDDLLVGVAMAGGIQLGVEWDDIPLATEGYEDDERRGRGVQPRAWQEQVPPELVLLPFPSTIGAEVCDGRGWSPALLTEQCLREAQMRDHLEYCRQAVGGKAFLFATEYRKAKGQTRIMRSRAQLNQLTDQLRRDARFYSLSRSAWLNLKPTEAGLKEFAPLVADDLQSVRSAIDHTLRGKRNTRTSWIWGGRLNSSDYVRKREFSSCSRASSLPLKRLVGVVQRHQFFTALAHRDRWQEELSHVRNEMQRVPHSFASLARAWKRRAEDCNGSRSSGHIAFARSQVSFWRYHANTAARAFRDLRKSAKYPPPAGLSLIFDEKFDYDVGQRI